MHTIRIGKTPNSNRLRFWSTLSPLNLYFSQSGKTFSFNQVPIKILIEIFKLLNSESKEVRKKLRDEHPNIIDRLKRYSICLFGANDGTVDWENGKLSPSKNFRCKPKTQCICLKYKNKAILINGRKLSVQEIEMMDQLSTEALKKRDYWL